MPSLPGKSIWTVSVLTAILYEGVLSFGLGEQEKVSFSDPYSLNQAKNLNPEPEDPCIWIWIQAVS